MAKKTNRSRYNLRKRKTSRRNVSQSSRTIKRTKPVKKPIKTTAERSTQNPRAKRNGYMPNDRLPLSILTESSQIQLATPAYELDDLVGLEHIKEDILNYVVYPFVDPERSRMLTLEAPRGILLVGKPGTGKTALASGIANAIKNRGIKVSFYVETGQCLNQYVGETEKIIRSLFQTAHENQPAIIFLDELDGLARRRNGRSDYCATILTTLLTEIGRVERGKVLLIAATNCPELVDPAVIRKGRFDILFNIQVPDKDGRKTILKHYFQIKEMDIENDDLEMISERTPNSAGADLEAFVNDVHREAIKRSFENRDWTKKGTPNKQFMQAKKCMTKVRRSDIMPVVNKFPQVIQEEQKREE